MHHVLRFMLRCGQARLQQILLRLLPHEVGIARQGNLRGGVVLDHGVLPPVIAHRLRVRLPRGCDCQPLLLRRHPRCGRVQGRARSRRGVDGLDCCRWRGRESGQSGGLGGGSSGEGERRVGGLEVRGSRCEGCGLCRNGFRSGKLLLVCDGKLLLVSGFLAREESVQHVRIRRHSLACMLNCEFCSGRSIRRHSQQCHEGECNTRHSRCGLEAARTPTR
mmetsp:Transcript_53625/g.125368  ORF Transcript_53625/g.125368 Transcript_53625/m.125368 type:complete len:220 (-) Transcript_53625:103-762(-)